MIAAFAVDCPGRRIDRRSERRIRLVHRGSPDGYVADRLAALGNNSNVYGKGAPRFLRRRGKIATAQGQLEGSLLAGNQGRRSKAGTVIGPGIYHTARSDGEIGVGRRYCHLGNEVATYIEQNVRGVTGKDADLSIGAPGDNRGIRFYPAIR